MNARKSESQASMTQSLNSFSEEISKKLEVSMGMVTQLSIINNQKIREFRERCPKMHKDIQALATITSTQFSILEEKYKLLYDLVSDIYARLEKINEEKV